MPTATTLFTNNRSQAVRLPADARFPPGVKRVAVRVRGQDRIIAPADAAWDSFFDGGETVSDDFMTERAAQEQGEREAL